MMRPDLLLTHLKGFLFLFPVIFFPAVILGGCNADHILQRLHHLPLIHLFRTQNDSSIFHTAGSLHDHMIARFYLQVPGIKVIYLSHIPEPDSNNFYHF